MIFLLYLGNIKKMKYFLIEYINLLWKQIQNYNFIKSKKNK